MPTEEGNTSGTNQNTADEQGVSTLLTDELHDDAAGGAGGGKGDGTGDGAGAGKGDDKGAGAKDGTNSDDKGGKTDDKSGKPDDKGKGDSEGYTIQLADGMEVDKTLLDSITPLLKAKNFTNEEVQQLAEAYAKTMTGNAQTLVEAQRKAWVEQLATWDKDIREDKDFGGKNFQSTIKSAQTVIARYGDDQLKKELKQFGIGNMPSLIRLLARAGKDMAEDGFHGGSGAKDVDKSLGELLYPTMTPEKS